jgi:hypothetical protein
MGQHHPGGRLQVIQLHSRQAVGRRSGVTQIRPTTFDPCWKANWRNLCRSIHSVRSDLDSGELRLKKAGERHEQLCRLLVAVVENLPEISLYKHPSIARVHFIPTKNILSPSPLPNTMVWCPEFAQISGWQCSIILPFLFPRLKIQLIPIVELLVLSLCSISTLICKSPDSNILCRLHRVILVPTISEASGRFCGTC